MQQTSFLRKEHSHDTTDLLKTNTKASCLVIGSLVVNRIIRPLRVIYTYPTDKQPQRARAVRPQGANMPGPPPASTEANDNEIGFSNALRRPASERLTDEQSGKSEDDAGLCHTICHCRQVLLILLNRAKWIFCPVKPPFPSVSRNINYRAVRL